jgi:hypothetical protein
MNADDVFHIQGTPAHVRELMHQREAAAAFLVSLLTSAMVLAAALTTPLSMQPGVSIETVSGQLKKSIKAECFMNFN